LARAKRAAAGEPCWICWMAPPMSCQPRVASVANHRYRPARLEAGPVMDLASASASRPGRVSVAARCVAWRTAAEEIVVVSAGRPPAMSGQAALVAVTSACAAGSWLASVRATAIRSARSSRSSWGVARRVLPQPPRVTARVAASASSAAQRAGVRFERAPRAAVLRGAAVVSPRRRAGRRRTRAARWRGSRAASRSCRRRVRTG
jgi:hypothetical protein